jgi:predicted HTH domain antitoxin
MPLQLNIPDSVANNLRLSATEAEPRLRAELAIALYAQSILPFGKASELAEVSRHKFADLLGERGLPRHYSEDDLAQDLEYVQSAPAKDMVELFAPLCGLNLDFERER